MGARAQGSSGQRAGGSAPSGARVFVPIGQQPGKSAAATAHEVANVLVPGIAPAVPAVGAAEATPYELALKNGYVTEQAVASGRAVKTGVRHPLLNMVEGYMLRPEKWAEN